MVAGRFARSFMVLVPLALALLVAPAAEAFHGSPYTARGTAVLEDQRFDAKLSWSGASLLGQGTFGLELRDPQTGLLVFKASVLGREEFSNRHFEAEGNCNAIEVFDYRAYATVATVPVTDVFEMTGGMRDNFCTGSRVATLSGHYLVFQLDLTIA